jgi:hypothetical protein
MTQVDARVHLPCDSLHTQMQSGGFRQILEGLQPGELVATEGAVFLSNMVLIGQAGG